MPNCLQIAIAFLRLLSRGLLYAIMLIPVAILTLISLPIAFLCYLADWEID
jgi:hypothetical protein